MFELFLEDGDLLEEIALQEVFFKRKKMIEPTISHKEAKNKAMSIMKKVLSDPKYSKFKTTIKVRLDKEDENSVAYYNVLSYGKNMRDDESDEFREWDSLYRSFEKEVNEELNQYGYFIDVAGDWDSGDIDIESPAIIKESFLEESSFLSKLMLPGKIRKYGKEEGFVVKELSDYLKKHYNPGLRKYIENSNDIDELQYIKADTRTLIPTINKIKERISLCKKLGNTDKTKNYYDYIKKHYIDKGITEKDCDACLEEIKKQEKMINDKIKELKNKE